MADIEHEPAIINIDTKKRPAQPGRNKNAGYGLLSNYKPFCCMAFPKTNGCGWWGFGGLYRRGNFPPIPGFQPATYRCKLSTLSLGPLPWGLILSTLMGETAAA